MSNHLKAGENAAPARCFLLLCYIAAIVAIPDRAGDISHKTTQHPLRLEDFANERLYHAYLVIQRFKKTITSDPKNVTATWTGRDICGQTERGYLGFHCGTPPGFAKKLTVTAVLLNGYDLRAPTLQGFIDQLPDLALFHAASNNFGNDIPSLGGLPYSYSLEANDINVKPPTKVDMISTFSMGCVNGNLTFKFNIDLDPKKKWGGWGSRSSIPAGATSARALLLNYNDISRPLPASLGSYKLSYLALANNKLTGPIPPSVAQMQDTLLEMLLLNNQLSGCLPQELGVLTKAAVVDAGKNQLTGPIPSSFSCLTSVEQLNLGGNRLYGEIPDVLCKLAWPAGRLSNLTLSSNYFTSAGTACAALVKDGVLDVKNNCIPGFAGQRPAAECAAFLSQLKTCPAPASTPVVCPATDGKDVAAPEGRVPRDYSSYVTYATLHE